MTTEDSVLSAITDSHLFASLDDEGRQRLMDGARAVRFESEQVIVREGDPGEALYVVKDGKVRVHTTKDGATVHLATLERGACFGEVSLLSGRPRTATVVADGPCTMLCFSRVQIEELLDAYPKVRRRLDAIVIGRARDTMRKLTRPTPAARRPTGEAATATAPPSTKAADGGTDGPGAKSRNGADGPGTKSRNGADGPRDDD